MRIVVPDDYSDALRRLMGVRVFPGHQLVVHTDPTDDPAVVADCPRDADMSDVQPIAAREFGRRAAAHRL